jgi:hypothetical protein
MNRKNDGEFRTVLLECRWRRGFSVLQIAVGIGVTIAFSYVLFAEESWGLKLLAAVVVFFGLIAVAVGIRNVINPFLLFAATSRGISMYMEGGGVRLAEPFFIPWERVESMNYEVRKAIDARGRRFTSKTIALKVKEDETWMPAERLKRNYKKSTSYIHLDAGTGTPSSQELLRRLEEIKAHAAASRKHNLSPKSG